MTGRCQLKKTEHVIKVAEGNGLFKSSLPKKTNHPSKSGKGMRLHILVADHLYRKQAGINPTLHVFAPGEELLWKLVVSPVFFLTRAYLSFPIPVMESSMLLPLKCAHEMATSGGLRRMYKAPFVPLTDVMGIPDTMREQASCILI